MLWGKCHLRHYCILFYRNIICLIVFFGFVVFCLLCVSFLCSCRGERGNMTHFLHFIILLQSVFVSNNSFYIYTSGCCANIEIKTVIIMVLEQRSIIKSLWKYLYYVYYYQGKQKVIWFHHELVYESSGYQYEIISSDRWCI